MMGRPPRTIRGEQVINLDASLPSLPQTKQCRFHPGAFRLNAVPDQIAGFETLLKSLPLR